MQWLPFSLLSIDFHLITGEILNVRPEYLINPAWAFYWGEFNKNNHCGWGIFSSGQNVVRGGWCSWGWGERHLNFLIFFFFLNKYPPLFLLATLLRTQHCFFQEDQVALPGACFLLDQKWPLHAHIAIRWGKKDVCRRKALPSCPAYAPTLTSSIWFQFC